MLAVCSSCLGLAPAPVIKAGSFSLRMLALELKPGHERYVTQVKGAGEAEWSVAAALQHTGGTDWLLDDSPVTLGTPDGVYADVMAMCCPEVRTDRGGLGAEVPHWPPEVVSNLERRRLHGSGMMVFCPEHFLSVIASSPMDTVVLLPHAESRLGVAGLRRAGRICRRVAASFKRCEAEAATTTVAKTTFDDYGRRRTSTVASANAAFLATMQAAARADERAWGRSAGVGRLIGEFDSGELAQLGDSLLDGLEAATGRGHITVHFPPDARLGMGFGPRAPSPGDGDEGGIGAEVGEVDAGGAAEAAGVCAGCVFVRMLGPTLELAELGFDEILDEIDRRRDAGAPLTLVLDTAAAIRGLYAVELPARAALAALAALAAAEGGGEPVGSAEEIEEIASSDEAEAETEAEIEAKIEAEAEIGSAVRALLPASLLWCERAARLFLGDAGSLTCCHTDLVPQLEMAHGLAGVKLLGVASHTATPRLSARHAAAPCTGDEEEEKDEDESYDDDDDDFDEAGATRVPTDRPLLADEASLLRDGDMSIVALYPGDMLAFSSGALHFASNGAAGFNAALYHGGITAGVLPRLRSEATLSGEGESKHDEGGYGPHSVLREIESSTK